MALYDNQPLALDRDSKAQRILGPIRERLLGVMRGGEDHESRPAGRRLAPYPGNDADTVDGLILRFPLARNGYDPTAVDEYVADLERELAALDRELAELRGQSAPLDEVQTQIKRVGEQTSAVLMAAHEQREEILRTAREEAERCVAEANGTARATIERAEARMRALEVQNEAGLRERDRLLTEIRTISTALAAVADTAEHSG